MWVLLSQTQCFLPCDREAPHPGAHTKEQDGLPWIQDHGFSYLVFWPVLLEYVSDQTSSPCMGWWGFIASSISQHYSHLNTIAPSVLGVGEWSHLCLENTDLSDGDQLVLPNLKDILGGGPGCKSTSSPEAIYSIGSHTISPSFPSWDNGKGEAPFFECVPPLFAVLHFPKLWQKHHLCTVYLYQIHWNPRVHNRCKGLENLVSART